MIYSGLRLARARLCQLGRRLWLVGAVVLIHACSVSPQLDVDQELQDELRRIDNWQAEGKLGIRVNSDAQSAYFDWHNQKNAFSLRLSGPFGQGTTWLRKQGKQVTLEAPDQPMRYATTAEQLMQAQLGWQVPVSNLRYWIKGIAAPGTKVTKLTYHPDGTLAELQQQGWHITYSRYTNHNGWALPTRLIAEFDTIKLTVIVKSWQLPAELDID